MIVTICFYYDTKIIKKVMDYVGETFCQHPDNGSIVSLSIDNAIDMFENCGFDVEQIDKIKEFATIEVI